MRAAINSVLLRGTQRSVELSDGLNILTGPIASGKTTMVRLCRSLFGASFEDMTREARTSVSAVVGEVALRDKTFTIARPAVTTANALVDISGNDGTRLQLPVYKSEAGGATYVRWLLDQLGLPRVEVPSRPTQPESEPTPVTIRDYLLYCALAQDEIGESVFGHTDPFKNIKRKYVFQIVYGIYSVEAAEIQEQLREVLGQLRELRAHSNLFARFFQETPLENRAAIERQLVEARQELDQLQANAIESVANSAQSPRVRELRANLLELRSEIDEIRASLAAEARSVEDLSRLAAQLETEAQRLTRAIVAGKHLTDIEFVVCPRCGADLDRARSNEDTCYVCLQEPRLDFSREILERERSRVEAQLSEAAELLDVRNEGLKNLQSRLQPLERRGQEVEQELNFQTESFVSARAAAIADQAARRASALARVRQNEDYLAVFSKLDLEHQLAEKLEVRRQELEAELSAVGSPTEEVNRRIEFLEETFDDFMRRLHPPEFGEEERCTIDRRTFLPVFRGRRFEELSSPGLVTLVNVAHALAHQRTALEFDLKLPNILFVDGLSEHFGDQGLDSARRQDLYDLLIWMSDEFGGRLQMIVADNQIPESARRFVRMELSEEDRLIPAAEDEGEATGDPD